MTGGAGRALRRGALLLAVGLGLTACGGGSGALRGEPPAMVVVERGDSVYLIARRHGVPMQEIISLNALRPPYIIHPGDELRLPRGGSAGAQSARAMLVPGEHFSAPRPPRRPDSPGRAPAAPTGTPAPTPAPSTAPSSFASDGGPAIVPPRVIAVTPMPSPADSPESRPAQPTEPAAPPQVAASPAPAPPEPAPQAAPQATVTPAPNSPDGGPPEPPPRADSRFLWPVDGRILSRFGTVSGGLHNDGINIAAERGTPIRAAENGIVAYAGNELRGYGNLILIRHADGWVTAYAHTDEMRVQRGQEVRAGQIIATVGSSGAVNTPQLHFELRQGTRAVDPLRELPPPTAQVSAR